jgi:hypothetical protein
MATIADAIGGFQHRARRKATPAAADGPVDAGQVLRCGLALTWLLDAALQYQPFMFSRAFSQTLSGAARGNPHVIAQQISWAAGIVADRPILANAVFATIQLLLAVGIGWRRTAKIALAASIAWSLGVWWFGEGLGGVLAGTASPVDGAPGAVILYALLAVLVWPAGQHNQGAPFAAARGLGAWPARLLWVVLWCSLAYLAIAPGNRSQQGLAQMVSGNAAGEPGWIAAMDRTVARTLAGVGTPVSVTLAEVLVVIAASVFFWPWLTRVTLVLAIVTATAFWVVGENFGGIYTGTATDPNTGPLLALLALAYWPAHDRPLASRGPAEQHGQELVHATAGDHDINHGARQVYAHHADGGLG